LAQLVIAPDKGVGMAAFANSSAGAAFRDLLRREVLALFDVEIAPLYNGAGEKVPASSFTGTYRRFGTDIEIKVDGDDLLVTITPTTEVLREYAGGSPTTVRCGVLGPRTLGIGDTALAFTVDDDFLFVGGRLHRRV